MDVNNTLVNGALLNADETLTDAEKNNVTPLYGNSRRVEPLLIYFGYGGLPASTAANLKLAPGSENRVRIFDNSTTPVAVLGGFSGSSPTSYSLTTAQKRSSTSMQFWIEGLAAGEAVVVLELTASGGSVPYHTESIKVEVNVDRSPTPASEVPTYGACHRVRAIKSQSDTRGIYGIISSRRPLLTWTPREVRVGMTSSLWFGFEPSSGNFVGHSWAQIGVEAALPPGQILTSTPTTDQSISFIYCEIAADYPAFAVTGDPRYFRRVRYETAPTPGVHKWQNLAGMIEYIPHPTSTLLDRIEIIRMPVEFGYSPMTTVQLVGDHEAGLPDVDLSVISFDEIQAGAESTASITRLPGIPGAEASVGDIRIKTGPRESISGWRQAEFTTSNLQIKVVDPNAETPAELLHQEIDPATGATSYLHYNIKLGNSYTIYLWDSYKWNSPEGKLW